MHTISYTLAIIKSEAITGEQTLSIDDTLVSVSSDDIPMGDAENVIKYIDLQLAHNIVRPQIRNGLVRLHSELALRLKDA